MQGSKARKPATAQVNGLPEVLQLGGLKVSIATSKPSGAQTPPPPRLAKPKHKAAEPPPPDPFAGLARIGSWLIIQRDRTGKRAVARCLHCSTVREISIADDSVAHCGCSGSWPGAGRFATPSGFASGIAGTEAHVAVLRHRGRR